MIWLGILLKLLAMIVMLARPRTNMKLVASNVRDAVKKCRSEMRPPAVSPFNSGKHIG